MAIRRVSHSCLAVSWIPSEAIEGLMRVPLDIGVGQYDPPPPDTIADIDAMIAAGSCRFANELTAWADIEHVPNDNPRIVDSGFSSRSLVAHTEMRIGKASFAIPPVTFPELDSTETTGDQRVTFTHTAGARTGAPFPRRVQARGALKLTAPTAWSQVAVTINADGTCEAELVGASHFPRHFFYDHNRSLVTKSATIDFRDWNATSHHADTPWGDAQPEINIAARETVLERALSTVIMQGGVAPRISKVEAGTVLMMAGEPATSIMLILDGLVEISLSGEVLAESGPGSILGERAALENGTRTSTVRALTAVRVAKVEASSIDREQLEELSGTHRREEDL